MFVDSITIDHIWYLFTVRWVFKTLLTDSQGVAPLTGTLMGKDLIERTSTFPITQAGLMPVSEQNKNLSAAFSYAAYGAQYLNGTLPAFTTPEYAILPFKPADGMKLNTNESWTASSTLYEGSLECTPGKVNRLSVEAFDGYWRGPQVEVSNADGSCKFWIDVDWADKYAPYSGWVVNELFLRYRRNLLYKNRGGVKIQCADDKIRNLLVGFWGRLIFPEIVKSEETSTGEFNNILKYGFNKTAAVFCYPKHTSQDVEITLDPAFMEIKDVQRNQTTTKSFDGLNTTYWHNVLVGQQSAALTEKFNVSTGLVIPKSRYSSWDTFRDSLDSANRGYQGLPDHTSQMMKRPQFETFLDHFKDVVVPEPDPIVLFKRAGAAAIDCKACTSDVIMDSIRPINTWIPNPNSFLPFGLTKQNDLEALLDHKALSDMLSSSYRYLFAMTIGTGISRYSDSSSKSTAENLQLGQRRYMQIGYVADPRWVRLSEGVLGAILVILICMMMLIWKRKCNLSGDPGTLASAMAGVDEAVLNEFEDAEFMSAKDLSKLLQDKENRYCLCENKIMISQQPINAAASNPTVDHDTVVCRKPGTLTVYAGAISGLILIGMVVLLVVLFARSQQDRGFAVPKNEFQYNIYSSYVPTIAAMGFEAFLVLLAGHVTLLYPFKQLKEERKTSDAGPLSINYDKVPPHLQLFSALKIRNFLLAALSMSILLANVLAVALGVLFQKDFQEFKDTGNLTMQGSLNSIPVFNATILNLSKQHRDYDMLYASTGDSLGIKKRPWTTDNFFYLPLSENPSGTDPRMNYTTTTWGIGVELSCQSMSTVERNSSWYRDLLASPDQVRFFQPGPWYQQKISAENPEHKTWDFYASFVRYDGSPPIPPSPPLPSFRLALPDETTSTTKSRTSTKSSSTSKAIGVAKETNTPTTTGIFGTASVTSIGAGGFNNIKFTSSSASTIIGDNPIPTRAFNLVSGSQTSFAFAAKPTPMQSDPIGLGPQVMLAKRQFLQTNRDPVVNRDGSDVNGYKVTNNVITCNKKPRIIKRQLEITNLTSGTIQSEGTIDDKAIPEPGVMEGLQRIMVNFEAMLLRVNSLDRITVTFTPGPQSWVAFFMQEEGLRMNKSFTLYDSPDNTARAMERAYRRLFATYLQLHSDEIFHSTPQTQPQSQAQSQPILAESTFVRKDSRVIMEPLAFWISCSLIALCIIPVTMWTYTALFNGFVCHQPTSLAGTYAAFYASDALKDMEGTEGIRSAERGKRLKALNHSYGYGWFVGNDSKKHYGIHRSDTKDFTWIV
jgi:hypothetical protein